MHLKKRKEGGKEGKMESRRAHSASVTEFVKNATQILHKQENSVVLIFQLKFPIRMLRFPVSCP